MSINIKPLEDRIVVKPLDAEQTTTYGRSDRATNGNNAWSGFSIVMGPTSTSFCPGLTSSGP